MSFREGPKLNIAKEDHATVTLPNGNVATFGGYSITGQQRLNVCEVFNVNVNSFFMVGNMFEKRDRPAAVSLSNGLVLITGGNDGSGGLSSCEIYHPSRNKFYNCKAKMQTGRHGHTATLLPNGKVLICGGYSASHSLRTTEIYDPDTNSFSGGPSMIMERYYHTANAFADGRILIAGGEGNSSCDSTEIYDPETDSFLYGPNMRRVRVGHFSVLLPDGRVLIGGGRNNKSKKTTEIYDPWTKSFSKGGRMLLAHDHSSAALF